MDNKRKSFGENIDIVLVNESEGICPLCGKPLIYEKKGRRYKGYQIAHIYPVNPTPSEVELLKSEVKLHSDINNQNNLIPLCETCHGRFDKPRTVEEYRELVKIKESLIKQVRESVDWHKYSLEEEVRDLIANLSSCNLTDGDTPLSYDPKTIDQKTDNTITQITKNKIKQQVNMYFALVKAELGMLDASRPGTSGIIASQIKTFYLVQKRKSLGQQEIYTNTVDWINHKCKKFSRDSCEIVVSFFVQNCEVFS